MPSLDDPQQGRARGNFESLACALLSKQSVGPPEVEDVGAVFEEVHDVVEVARTGALVKGPGLLGQQFLQRVGQDGCRVGKIVRVGVERHAQDGQCS